MTIPRLRSLLLPILLVAAPAAGAQEVTPDASPQALVDSAVVLVRKYALYRDSVSWDTLVPALRRRVAGARTAEEAYPVLGMLTRALGDRHSHVRVPPPGRAPSVLGSGSSAGELTPRRRAEPPIEPRYFERFHIGYLRVPSHGGGDVELSRTMAAGARAAIAEQRERGACGWVVDVRGNTGGNMWPMLAALRPLLGQGTLGAFVSPEENEPWGARAPWDRDDRYAKGTPAWPDLSDAPVAVLTNGFTASSGEAVVTAFRGRPNTRSFGAATAGLSTANNGYPLPGGVMMLLTTAVFADRTGATYGGFLLPDVPVREVPDRDAPMEAAVEWLQRQPACAAR